MTDFFPLELAPIEEYFLADDTTAYPMTFVIEMGLQGELQREILEPAVRSAISSHPLLQSLVRRRLFRSPQWVLSTELQPRMDWGELQQPIEPADHGRIDLTREIGLRFWVRVGNQRSRLVVQFHHACCDAQGGLAFLTDLVVEYGRLSPGQATIWKPSGVQPTKLLCRDDLHVHFHEPVSKLRFARRCLEGLWRLMSCPAAPLEPPRRDPAAPFTPIGFADLFVHRFSTDVYPRLRRYAHRHAATVNDVLVRELMLTMREWNCRQATAESAKWLSVIVPTNLRTLEHDDLPAANVLSFLIQLRQASDCDSPDTLLESLRAENEFVKNWRYTATLLSLIRWARKVPGLLRLITARKSCQGTAGLSYLGNPLRMLANRVATDGEGLPLVGELKLTDIVGCGPVRPLTRASFCVWCMNEELQITLRCDPHVFSSEDAQALLKLYADHLSQLAATVRGRQRKDNSAAA